jgi:hypothetical protein
MSWINTVSAATLVADKYAISSLDADQITQKAVRDGCGHPKRFVRGVALGKNAPEPIVKPLDDDAEVLTLCATILATRYLTYFNVEVHAAKFLAYVEDEDLLGWFGVLPGPQEMTLSEEERKQIDGFTGVERRAFNDLTLHLKEDPDAARDILEKRCEAKFGVKGRSFRRVLKAARSAAGTNPNPAGRRANHPHS